MNNDRLKFAWARGARLETWRPYGTFERREAHWSDLGGWASSTSHMEHCQHRVHPDDAHLEYGPISSAMRDRAIYDEMSDEAAAGYLLVKDCVPRGIISLEEMDTAQTIMGMFALFAAEYLADEGL